jgi:hypothetical protein
LNPPARLTLTAAAAAAVLTCVSRVIFVLANKKKFAGREKKKKRRMPSFDTVSGIPAWRPGKEERKEAAANCLANAPARDAKKTIQVREWRDTPQINQYLTRSAWFFWFFFSTFLRR